MDEPSLLDSPENDPQKVLLAKINQTKKRLAWERLKPKPQHCRIEGWFKDLGLNPSQRLVLGRIWSFQVQHEGDGACYESVAAIADVTGVDKSYVKKYLKKMVDMGILFKESRGQRKPASYRIDLAACADLIDENKRRREEARPDVSAARREQWQRKHGSEDEQDSLF